MKRNSLFAIVLTISSRWSHAGPVKADNKPAFQPTSAAPTLRSNTTNPALVDPEALEVAATKPRSNGELLTSTELFEGDILGMVHVEFPSPGTSAANDDLSGLRNWPDNLIPYVLSKTFRPKDKQVIRNALQDFMAKTTVKFREREHSDADYVYIAPGYGCSSYVGRTGGQQLLVLQVPGCLNRGYIHHELMHTLGFFHEQARIDRDENVEINWDNIPKAQHSNFKGYDIRYSLNEFQPYDVSSLMHYGMYDFAIDKHVWTIRPKAGNNNSSEAAKMGQRNGLSAVDVNKIKSAYPSQLVDPGTACPEGRGWAQHQQICYFFSFLTDTPPRDFGSARTFCREQKAKIYPEPKETVRKFFTAQMHSLDSQARIYVADCSTISPANVDEAQEGDCTAELHFICSKPLSACSRLSASGVMAVITGTKIVRF